MRRRSYLTRIVEEATGNERRPILVPPRLLFRPTLNPFDPDPEAVPVPMHHRPEVPRHITSRAIAPSENASELRSRPRPPAPRLGPEAVERPAYTPSIAALPRGDRPSGSHVESGTTRRTPEHPSQPLSEKPALPWPLQRESMPRKKSPVPEVNGEAPAHAVLRPRTEDAVSAAGRKQTVPGRDGDHGSARSLPLRPDSGWKGTDRIISVAGPPQPRRTTEPLQKAAAATRIALTPPELRPVAPLRKERETRRRHVHIGTLELRILPPTPVRREPSAAPMAAAPARRAASAAQPRAPLARGFGVFGLSQS